MSQKISLNLDDVLEDSPQTRCMLNVFENDALKVNDYMQTLQSVLERLVAAQTEITSAIGELGSLLHSYKDQNFPLEHNEYEFPNVVDKFQGTVIELSSWTEIVSQQLNNCSLYPVTKFLREMNDLLSRKDVFHSIAGELDVSILKHAKLSKKDNSRKWEEVNEELRTNRRRFHLAGLHYYENLNKLQYTRRIALLEPILSVIYAFRSFCHVGHQALSPEKESFAFFTRTQEQLQSLHNEQESEWHKYQELIKTVNEIERLNPSVYNVEQSTTECPIESPESPKQTAENVVGPIGDGSHVSNTEKQGYLFLKCKSGLLNKWDRLYFFIQNGNLMAQARDEIAGKSMMDLNPCVKAVALDQNEDRRHTFSVMCYKTKRNLILQASSTQERQQWIDVVNGAAANLTPYQAQVESETTSNTVIPSLEVGMQSKLTLSTACDVGDEPIQFDLLTPSGQQDDQVTNDLSASKNSDEPGEFTYHCPVKFLGSLDISDDKDNRLVKKATEKILETRKQFNITKYVDVTMVVEKQVPNETNSSLLDRISLKSTNQKMARLLLIDKSTREIKASFRLDDLASWNPTEQNMDIVALVIRTRLDKSDGRHRFTCYLLQAFNESQANEICKTLTDSSCRVFQSLIHGGILQKNCDFELTNQNPEKLTQISAASNQNEDVALDSGNQLERSQIVGGQAEDILKE